MKCIKTILLCFFGLANLAGQASFNMVNLGNWHDPTLPFSVVRYNDVWGYAANGREYALIGSRNFVHILDVTDPANITEIARLNDAAGSSSIWRDIKIYGSYAYMSTEAQEGLQVIDLSNLPTSASVLSRDVSRFARCHNLLIDSTSSPVRLYAMGTQGGTSGGQFNGVVIYSLAAPSSPTFISSVPLAGGYVHDAFVINDTLYANHGNPGMKVYDFSNPMAPVDIGSLEGYIEEGYNHSCWRSANGKYLAMCDETNNRGVKIVDVQDPLDMEVVGLFRSTLLAPNMNSLAHNPFYLGDSLVVLSYYGDGVQVWDVRNPANPRRLAYYDTTPTGTGYNTGVWGAYPYLPSGNILASDEVTGLYVVRVNDFQALPVEYNYWKVLADGKNALLKWSTATETDNASWEVEHANEDGQFAGVGFVEAAGSGEYTFTHPSPGPGTHYYRLRQRDLDGTEAVNEVRSVVLAGAAGQLSIWPNPAPAGAEIRLDGLNPGAAWALSNVEGKVVLTGSGQSIPAVQLPGGIYFIQAEGRAVEKLVVH